MADWGCEFSENMPEEIREAILNARADGPSTLQDEEYRKRLQDKFGSRWLTTQLVQRQNKANNGEARDGTPIDETAQVTVNHDNGQLGVRKPKRKKKRRVHVVHLRANAGGDGQVEERLVAVDVPRFAYVSKDEFEDPWHLATWVPNDPEGPTVLMNRDCPILLEAIKYHQAQYPDIYAQDVEEIVKNTYGEVAVCKIAHSQKLVKYVPEQDLDDMYRTDAALTIALMGLLAEESLIAQRLGRLGRKKSAA